MSADGHALATTTRVLAELPLETRPVELPEPVGLGRRLVHRILSAGGILLIASPGKPGSERGDTDPGPVDQAGKV